MVRGSDERRAVCGDAIAMDEEPTDEARELEQMIDRTFTPQASDTVRAMLREIRDGVPQQHIQWIGTRIVGDLRLAQCAAQHEHARAEQLAAELEQRDAQKPTPEDVIRKYYRRHARNPKITLKQVCAEMGVNYASIRVTKVAYDKRRRHSHKD